MCNAYQGYALARTPAVHSGDPTPREAKALQRPDPNDAMMMLPTEKATEPMLL